MGVYRNRGNIVRVGYLTISALCWLITGGKCCRNKGMLVLCYHGVTSKQKKQFSYQMSRLRKYNKAEEKANNKAGHQKPNNLQVIVTFDDAFANLLDNALPALEQYQIPAIVFAVTGNLGQKPRWEMPPGHMEAEEMIMTEDELVALARNPLMSLGSHTLTHPDLTKISCVQAEEELSKSKQYLEELLGYKIEDLALPHGAFNDEIVSQAEQLKYKRIFTLIPQIEKDACATGLIGRFSMSPDVWRIEFLLTCAGAYAWLYHLRRILQKVRRWTK